jgi:predicted PurR-regulated permease PerM
LLWPLEVVGALVLIVAALHWARAILIPVALATLLTILLSPVHRALQRLGLGRACSVLTFALISLTGWAITAQMRNLANNLPTYQINIKKRVEELPAGKGTTLDKVRTAFGQFLGKADANASPAEKAHQPIRVTVQGARFSAGAWPLVQPLLAALPQILLVVMLVPALHYAKRDGRFGLLSEDDREVPLAAGATHVTATLIETHKQIAQALHPHAKLTTETAAS